MKGYRLTTLGKVVLFSLLFLIVLSTAYTVKAFKYKLNNGNSLNITTKSIVPIEQNNRISIFKEINIPYDNRIAIYPEIDINKLINAKLTIYFEADDDLVKDQYFDALDIFVNVADILKDYIVEIEGNCATVYTDVAENRNNIISYNLSLSRAKSVSNYLQKKGIAEKRIVIIGNGSNNPVKSNATEDERAYNRRVEVTFVPNKKN